MIEGASVLLRSDGTYEDASPGALDILGVTREELLALPAGTFSVEPPDHEARAAFRATWEQTGMPDVAGEATIRRPDGDERRVKFLIRPMDDGRMIAVLEEAEGPREAPPKVFTAGDVLAAWRAAERRLETLTEESPEWASIQADIDSFREQYQRLFRTNRSGEVR